MSQPDTAPEPKRGFNANHIGLAILVVAFAAGLFDILRPRAEADGRVVDEDRVVHFLHWQLEPGFREALDAVIADYNRLPHVREQGYKVRQMAVTERVYRQFLNVHLISGTAPDLAAASQHSMAANRAQFFEPFLEVLERPNPYNAPEWLPPDMEPRLAEFLSSAAWKETFVDGLQGSVDATTGYVYTIPVATWGTIRMYVNRSLLGQAKQVLREAFAMPERPAWLEAQLSDRPDETPLAMLPDSPGLRAWLAGDASPQTFGQLILLCEALRVHAQRTGNTRLVPIAGSSYSRDIFASIYNASFFYAWEDKLDYDLNSQTSNLELFAAFEHGRWDFDDPRLRAYFELQVRLATYFPAGFLGLDREQANRRFILGNALFLVTGAWDAAGIFIGSQSRLNPADRFEVEVINLPVPARDERWGRFDPRPRAEALFGGGVPMALYKFSRNKKEATDFLLYLTGVAANQKFIEQAGWLPAVIGPQPAERMRPFLPDQRGVAAGLAFNMTGGNVQTIYNGQYYLLISRDIPFDTFVERVTAAMRDPRNGMDRQWHAQFIQARDTIRTVERSLSVQRLHQLLEGRAATADPRYIQVLHRSSSGLSGLGVPYLWRICGYERPFPQF